MPAGDNCFGAKLVNFMLTREPGEATCNNIVGIRTVCKWFHFLITKPNASSQNNLTYTRQGINVFYTKCMPYVFLVP